LPESDAMPHRRAAIGHSDLFAPSLILGSQNNFLRRRVSSGAVCKRHRIQPRPNQVKGDRHDIHLSKPGTCRKAAKPLKARNRRRFARSDARMYVEIGHRSASVKCQVGYSSLRLCHSPLAGAAVGPITVHPAALPAGRAGPGRQADAQAKLAGRACGVDSEAGVVSAATTRTPKQRGPRHCLQAGSIMA
jgi:hypothetical protein